MLLASNVFLFYFLPICIFAYYLAKKEYRNYILLVASLFFYAWGEPIYLVLILVSIALNYIFALLVDRFRDNAKLANIIIGITVAANMSVLGYYKYSAFLITNLNSFLGINLPLRNLTLPIGISFFTFQALAYVIDVKKNNGKVQKNPLNLALYISFFPKLMAGPILRYGDFEAQLQDRNESSLLFSEGVRRFIFGLGKKIILANTFAQITDTVFAADIASQAIGIAWLGAVSYTIQIYFDFSGYSDMAIGLGKMFGFQIPENFNYPYISRSITEFWRRWHISLSTWFRDYVYIPLGGSRNGIGHQIINLFVVWCFTGLWHGANWTFIAWGLYYFFFLVTEKMFLKSVSKIPVLSNVITMLIVIVGWVLFRSNNIADACDYIKVMFGFGVNKQFYTYQLGYYLYEYRGYLLLGILACIPWGSLSVFKRIKEKFRGYSMLEFVLMSIIMVWCVALLAANSYNPFIYFNF